MLDFEVTECHRLIANLVRIGRVLEVDVEQPQARVAIGTLKTAWLPLLCLRAGSDQQWWPVDVDEQVLVLSTSGDLTQGVIIGALHQARFPANTKTTDIHCCSYSDGAVMEYNKTTHCLNITLPLGANVNITADVLINGNITATGNISDATGSMQADREIYNRHQHAGVSSGSSSTSTPSEAQ